MKKGIYI